MEKSCIIPRYLDEPERLLLWTIDEVATFIIPMLAGIYSQVFWLGLLGGLVALLTYAKFKKKFAKQYLGFCYWHLPAHMFWHKSFAPSSHRILLG